MRWIILDKPLSRLLVCDQLPVQAIISKKAVLTLAKPLWTAFSAIGVIVTYVISEPFLRVGLRLIVRHNYDTILHSNGFTIKENPSQDLVNTKDPKIPLKNSLTSLSLALERSQQPRSTRSSLLQRTCDWDSIFLSVVSGLLLWQLWIDDNASTTSYAVGTRHIRSNFH